LDSGGKNLDLDLDLNFQDLTTSLSYALVYGYYRSSQLFRHTSLLTLAGERAARVLLTISPDFEKIRSQGTVVAGVFR